MENALGLTGEERILLYMLNFGSLDDAYECDPGVTQKGISLNARIQRKHVSRHLLKLISSGFLEEHVRRVSGAKQRMKCYGLTSQGLAMSRSLERQVEGITLKVQIGDRVRNMRIGDIDGATSVHLRLSDIVCEAMAADILDMEALEQIEECNRRMMDDRTMRSDVYRRALAAAWRSGILTSSEKHLVDALKAHLGITDREHNAMETEAMNCPPEPMETRADLQDEILNLLAGQPPELAQEVIEMLRKRMAASRKP